MRCIDRGPEPAEVAGLRQLYTQGWVDYFQNRTGEAALRVAGLRRLYTQGWANYFQNRTGERPSDFEWSKFRPALASRSGHMCWYCERQCDAETGGRAPTVDHFRPLSRFPKLAYEWSNWAFSCRRCNVENKKDNWPHLGYVDPAAAEVAECPDRYFDYDAATGEIIPKPGLTGDARQRAWQTIKDLGLNKLDVMYDRFHLMTDFAKGLLSLAPVDRPAFADYFTQQSCEYSGIVGMVIEQLRQDGHI